MIFVKAFSKPPTLILVDGVPDARGRKAGLYELQRGRVDGQPAWRSLVSPDSWLVHSNTKSWIFTKSFMG